MRPHAAPSPVSANQSQGRGTGATEQGDARGSGASHTFSRTDGQTDAVSKEPRAPGRAPVSRALAVCRHARPRRGGAHRPVVAARGRCHLPTPPYGAPQRPPPAGALTADPAPSPSGKPASSRGASAPPPILRGDPAPHPDPAPHAPAPPPMDEQRPPTTGRLDVIAAPHAFQSSAPRCPHGGARGRRRSYLGLPSAAPPVLPRARIRVAAPLNGGAARSPQRAAARGGGETAPHWLRQARDGSPLVAAGPGLARLAAERRPQKRGTEREPGSGAAAPHSAGRTENPERSSSEERDREKRQRGAERGQRPHPGGGTALRGGRGADWNGAPRSPQDCSHGAQRIAVPLPPR